MSATKFPDLFAALAAPFDPSEVKQLPKGGKRVDFITARTVMNRLDEVLGPEGWWDHYIPAANSVLCQLSISLPDGQVIVKEDAGGYAGMADQGDDDKSGYSDALEAGRRQVRRRAVPLQGRCARFRPAPGNRSHTVPRGAVSRTPGKQRQDGSVLALGAKSCAEDRVQ